jgi:glutamine synthetase adenylyltransferase
MVTIDANKPIQPLTKTGNTDRPSKSQGEGFDAVFRQEMTGKTTAPATTESSSQVGGIRPAWFANDNHGAASRAFDRVEQLIDTMAAYQNKLIDNGATLRDIHSLVQQMSSQSESLEKLADKMDASDNLKTIVNQSLMLSSMEISKYYNGHYVD